MEMKLFDDEYVRLHPYFRISIGDIGGHVRTLEYYYEFFSKQSEIERIKLETEEMMTEEEKLKTAVRNVNIEKIMKSVKRRIQYLLLRPYWVFQLENMMRSCATEDQ